MVSAPAERPPLQVESVPLGRAGAAPDAPRRVGGLTENDIVEARKQGECVAVITVHLSDMIE